VKPIQKDILIHKVRTHLKTNTRWQELQKDSVSRYERILPSDFIQFKEFLFDQLNLNPGKKYELSNTSPSQIYSISSEIGINGRKVAQYIAEFLKLPYVSHINPGDVQLGVLPTPFCRSNHILALDNGSAAKTFVLSNPFDWDLLDNLEKYTGQNETFELIISEPDNIDLLFKDDITKQDKEVSIVEDKQKIKTPAIETLAKVPESEIKKHPIVYIANSIINKAVSERASDIHIEPKETNTVVRFRIDGDLREFFTLKKNTGAKIISRFKVIGGLDIAEKRKSQDGAFAAIIDNRTFNLRVASTSTPNGESVVIRLLEPYAKPKDLKDLGMTDKQVNTLINLADRTSGLILIVGPTGSGKTTTTYSLLYKTDWETRNLISIEDPVEYRMPFANQQQVNEKGGVSFDALLKGRERNNLEFYFRY